jgi:hypothetical protein
MTTVALKKVSSASLGACGGLSGAIGTIEYEGPHHECPGELAGEIGAANELPHLKCSSGLVGEGGAASINGQV